jgi:amidase
MYDHDYEHLDGLALASLLERGETTPEELMACAIRLARERAPALNALCYEQYDASLELARHWEKRGAFAGIPFLLKDSGLASTRFASSIGSRLFNDTRYERDATLTHRFDRAGLIPFARSTVPELCMAPTTEAVRNGGPTRNPWDPGRSAGGSSGGAAAAVAAGIVPLAHGSDGGGSIRIPASCCGLFGLKPSRGRVPMGPLRGEGWGGLAVDGVLSRSVRDTAAALDAVSGYESGAPYGPPPNSTSLNSVLGKDFARPLRILVWKGSLNDAGLAPECVAAVEHTAQLCASLGHELSDGAPPATLDYEAFIDAHTQVLAANIVLSVDQRLAVLKRNLRDDDLEPAILDGYTFGKSISAGQYASAINRFHAIGRIMDACFAEHDIILTSTLAQLPAPLGMLDMQGSFREFRQRVSTYSTFLTIVNASGQPAASVPTYWTQDHLPVGSQIIGRFGREDMLVQLASQFERSGHWQPALQRTKEPR